METENIRPKPVVLMILDGFGISPEKNRPACEAGKCSIFEELEKNFPLTALQASGIAVGLPWGEAGNSEVGHLAIGAGKVIYNYLPKISTAISNGSFFQNEALLKAVEHVKQNNSALHLSGLFSSGTVHAYFEHLYAILKFTKENNVERTYLHLYTDGKDAKKKEGAQFYKKFEGFLQEKYPQVKIASIIGRGKSMNRDGDWDKTETTYNLFVKGGENKFDSPSDYIAEQYPKEIYDSVVPPAMTSTGEGRISNNDALIFFNFREDSMRQIAASFTETNFDKFQKTPIENLLVVTMTEYDKKFPCLAAFDSAKIENPLAKVVAKNGLTQLHIAETEKYAHITYFLNGGQEKPFKGEDRIMVPSPDTTSYDLTPEMSASTVADVVIGNLSKYDFIAVNFANADMVGHTGNLEATLEAVRELNTQIGRIYPKVLEIGGCLIITSDHGNSEEKIYKLTGEKRTKHSINPVPFFLISNEYKKEKLSSPEEITSSYKDVRGALADVAPTVLELLGLNKPVEMTGKSLLAKFTKRTRKKESHGFFSKLFGGKNKK